MQDFVRNDSIVRKIWGKSDTILFIFAGAAAEFALNKAVDWLFFTGRLPADPLGRLFSTVSYARKIVFSTTDQAHEVIDAMAHIHKVVEQNRNMNIPAWAYRDVLYMLIDYSIRAHELVVHALSYDEKIEVYDVFRRVGLRMGIPNLPENYDAWLSERTTHMQNDLQQSEYTTQLFRQYKKHLGTVRYQILLDAQSIIIPNRVKFLLGLRTSIYIRPMLWLYKLLSGLGIEWFFKKLILPKKYFHQVRALET